MVGHYFDFDLITHFRRAILMSGVLSGLNAWVLQRASAVYLLLFALIMPGYILYLDIDSFNVWHAFIASPIISISWILFFVSLFAHAWVGIRDVVIDYVHSFRIRLFILSMIAVYLIAMMIWVVRILFIPTGVIA